MRCHAHFVGENLRMAIVAAGGMGRSHVANGHVKNKLVVTLRNIDNYNLVALIWPLYRPTWERHGAGA